MPVLFIHESCHYVTGLLCGYYFSLKESRYVWNPDGTFCFLLEEKKHQKRFIKSIIVSLAPLFFVIAIGVLAFFYHWCIYLLVYLLLVNKYSFPSRGDWDKVKYHTLFKKYQNNHRAMALFFTLKGYYKDLDEDENLDFLDIDFN